MVEILNCPTRAELVRLNNDKLPADRSETLYDHIETCDQCAEIYADLEEPADDFAKRLARLTPDAITGLPAKRWRSLTPTSVAKMTASAPAIVAAVSGVLPEDPWVSTVICTPARSAASFSASAAM